MMNDFESKTAKKPNAEKAMRIHVLTSQFFQPETYEYDFRQKPANLDDPWSIHTTVDMLRCLEKNKGFELDARVLSYHQGQIGYRKLKHPKIAHRCSTLRFSSRLRKPEKN